MNSTENSSKKHGVKVQEVVLGVDLEGLGCLPEMKKQQRTEDWRFDG